MCSCDSASVCVPSMLMAMRFGPERFVVLNRDAFASTLKASLSYGERCVFLKLFDEIFEFHLQFIII